MTRWDCGYSEFLQRREHEREVALTHAKKFDERLANEEVWIRQGIKARRTRNEGRVRRLEAMREERAARRRQGNLKIEIDAGMASGKIVKEAAGVSKFYDGRAIVSNLDLIIQRGDRIGILGPNGVGKTTLVQLLLEKLPPDEGTVKTGTRLATLYFDQTREQLEPEQSVANYISEGREYITINGKDVHVVTYLGNFLFSPDQSRAPIRTLSGGQQNRLLLARLFSQPANFMVLDEPTNDLDVETLELLEEQLAEFEGTALIVSHDRAFLDNVTTSLLVMAPGGKVTEFFGGYSDWQANQPSPLSGSGASKKSVSGSKGQKKDFKAARKDKADRRRLARELDSLTTRIESSEARLDEIHASMAEPGFFELSAAEQAPLTEEEKKLNRMIEADMAAWEALEMTLAAMDDGS